MKKHLIPKSLALFIAACFHLALFYWLSQMDWMKDFFTPYKTAELEIQIQPVPPSTVSTEPLEEVIPSQAQADNQERNNGVPETENNAPENVYSFSQEAFDDFFASDLFNDLYAPLKQPDNLAPPLATEQNEAPISANELESLPPVSVDTSRLYDIGSLTIADEELTDTRDVFSPELKKQIKEAKADHKEYLRSQEKEHNYPITEDADGTRYVNIEGVCWKIPNDPTKEEWAIVLSGCGGQTKTFHFELNIAPDLLGPDSPFLFPQE